MAAPPGAMLKSQTMATLPPKQQQHPAFIKFVTALTDETSTAWGSFINGSKWGKLTVTGAGVVPIWAGVGLGGSIKAPKFKLDVDAIKKAGELKHPASEKMLKNLAKVLEAKFKDWASSYKFAGVAYLGSSTALPPAPPALPVGAPGTFNAINTPPVPLIAAGVGMPLMGIAKAWEDKLSSTEDGDAFKVDHPYCRVKDFTKAYATAIESSFTQIFLTTTMVMGNSVSGTAAAGTGAGSATSEEDGKLV